MKRPIPYSRNIEIHLVAPAGAGAQKRMPKKRMLLNSHWIPAGAGMTDSHPFGVQGLRVGCGAHLQTTSGRTRNIGPGSNPGCRRGGHRYVWAHGCTGKVTCMVSERRNERLDPVFALAGDPIQCGRRLPGLMLEINDDFGLIPGIAAAWDLSDDGLVGDYAHRKGVKFHVGSELMPDDGIWSWNHYYWDPTSRGPARSVPELFAVVQKVLGTSNLEEPVAALQKTYQRLRDEQCYLGVGYVNIPWAGGPREVLWEPRSLSLFPNDLHNLILE